MKFVRLNYKRSLRSAAVSHQMEFSSTLSYDEPIYAPLRNRKRITIVSPPAFPLTARRKGVDDVNHSPHLPPRSHICWLLLLHPSTSFHMLQPPSNSNVFESTGNRGTSVAVIILLTESSARLSPRWSFVGQLQSTNEW